MLRLAEPAVPGCGHRVVVAEGGEDVTIKVSDEGGGIPRSGLASIWTYLYSTAKQKVQMETLQVRLSIFAVANRDQRFPTDASAT